VSVNLIRHLFAAIDAQHWNELDRFFRADIVYERPGYLPLVGLVSVRRFYEQVRVISAGEHIIEGVVASDGRGACWGRFNGINRDGSTIEERWADVYTFVDGRISTRRSHFFRPAV